MNIYEKFLEIRKAAPKIKQDVQIQMGRGSYSSVSHDSVLDALNKEIDKQKLLLLPKIIDSQVKVETKGTTNILITLLKIEFTWLNVEDTEETVTIPWVGEGIDPTERGLGKALSYAEKYFLIRFFRLQSEENNQPQSQSYQVPSQSYQSQTQLQSQPQQSQPQQQSYIPISQINVTDPNWINQPVGFKRTANLTWRDLLDNKRLPDGKDGLTYLKNLAKWKNKPEIAEIAQIALAYDQNKNTDEGVPF